MNCSVCGKKLNKEGKSFCCENGHRFDIAKQGYVNLSRKQKETGDNKAMVQARTNFLEKGYYDFLRKQVAAQIESLHPHSLVDIGCGQGYYTMALAAPEKYGIDLSKEAIVYAAAHDKSTQYIVDTIYDLPFADGSLDGVVSIFTPLPWKEIERVLKPGGFLITVSPAKKHLIELKEQLYEKVYENREEREDVGNLVLVDASVVSDKKRVDDVWDLFEMTPYRYKSPKEGMERVRALKELEVTFSFLMKTFRKKSL
ncbi:methyltransferase domain-containing protein [uncultured Dubosiella sp.]|uniref:methyltransferase domain-containing protein n=2 Tax=uncultured Dubosiella sp. TaxID=1937011 RepID=UPI0025B36B14|nr:methyltransferase domain-containing protein [uncultured Dubosiella sp.]